METLLTLITAIAGPNGDEGIIQDDSFTTSDITKVLNRGLLEIAGGGTRDYSVPTIPGLPLLRKDFTVATGTSNSATMPTDYQRDAWDGYNQQEDRLTLVDSLRQFRAKYGLNPTETTVSAFCVVGNTIYFNATPSTSVDLTIPGFRYPDDMENDGDIPDGIPAHLSYRLLVNFACMEIFLQIEQDENGSGPNFLRHKALYGEALKELHDFCPKDEPDEYVTYYE